MPLLVTIYLYFISSGFPFTAMGAAWPVMHKDLGVPVSAAGIPIMIVSVFTVIASMAAARISKKIAPPVIMIATISLATVSLFVIAFSAAFWQVCAASVFLGIENGANAAVGNDYVTKTRKSSFTVWLNSCWGIGATVGPLVMAACMKNYTWNTAFLFFAVYHLLLAVAFASFKKQWQTDDAEEATKSTVSLMEILGIYMFPVMAAAFFCYSSLEGIITAWTSSFLVISRHIAAVPAARYSSVIIIGITVGRIVGGFLSERLGDKGLIRAGLITAMPGIGLLTLTGVPEYVTAAGLFICGFGISPVTPAIIHSAPANFGKEHSMAVIGTLIALANIGAMTMTPLYGEITTKAGMGILPLAVFILASLILILTEIVNLGLKRKCS